MPLVFFSGLVLVTVLSLGPSTSIPEGFRFWDKAQHALAYLALALTGCLAFPRHLMPVLLGLLAHGAAIEVLQATLTTTRFGDALDWVADATGIVAGTLAYLAVARRPRDGARRED